MKFDARRQIRPKALKKGDVIGIVAPAGPFDKELFERGIAVIHEMGFETRVDSGVYQRQGFLAGDDAHRAAQVNTAVSDDGVRAVLCARGGYGSLRLLGRLDYGAVALCAKPIIGFSDITALHRAIHLMTGLVTFHGPMVTTLARSDEAALQSWRDALLGRVWPGEGFSDFRVLRDGLGEGVLAGGNLATLCHMVGTPYGADYEGAILMIEDVGEAPYRLDRMLTQMKLAGALDGVQGVVMGSFEQCGDQEEIEALMMERFAGLEIPIVAGAPFGHGVRNVTLPLGVRARLDTSGAGLTLLEGVFEK